MKSAIAMRKKGIVLAALLLTTLLLTTSAIAQGGSMTLFDTATGQWKAEAAQTVASVKGTLYIARTEGLYAWNEGMPRLLMDFTKEHLDGSALNGQPDTFSPVYQLISDGSSLYAMDGKMQGLWCFDEAANVFVNKMSYNPSEVWQEDANSSYLYSNFLVDRGDLYYIASDSTTIGSSLIRLNADSGKAEVLKSGVYTAACYNPGKLIVANGTYGWPDTVSVLDLDTGSMMYKMDISKDVRQIYFENGLDMLYLLRKGAIYTSVAFGEPKLAARIPVISSLGGTHLNGGYAALVYEDGVRVYPCDPAAVSDEPLTLVGQTMDLPLEDYSVKNPDTTFAFSDFFPANTADMVTHMMSGDGAADIYVLQTSSYHLDALYEKGYFAGLEGSSIIAEAVGSMYPFIKEQIYKDGKIMALPFANTYYVPAYNPDLFEEVGLDTQDVPATYDELLDFIAMWGESYREEFSSLSLFGQDADAKFFKRLFASAILADRKYDCLRSGQPITYDTPQMRALLNKLMAADFSVIDAVTKDTKYDEFQDQDHPPLNLLSLETFASSIIYSTAYLRYMPLRLYEDKAPVVLSDMQVLIINPYSRHFSQALDFVEYVAANLSDRLCIDLMPDRNEPLKDPFFDVTWLYEKIKKTEEAIQSAKDEDKRTLQDTLDRLKTELKSQLKDEWLVTKDSLASFRALDPYFVLKQPDPIVGMGSNEDISDLFYNRFLQGQITVEQFLKELDQKMRMLEREN